MNLYFPCRPCLPYTGVWGGRIFFYTWTLTSSPFVTSGSRLSSWICRNGPRSRPQELSGARMKPFQASQTLVPPAPRPYICLTEKRTLGLFSLDFLYHPVSCLVSLHHSSFVNWERIDLLAPGTMHDLHFCDCLHLGAKQNILLASVVSKVLNMLSWFLFSLSWHLK